jgi:hypothetical protein
MQFSKTVKLKKLRKSLEKVFQNEVVLRKVICILKEKTSAHLGMQQTQTFGV